MRIEYRPGVLSELGDLLTGITLASPTAARKVEQHIQRTLELLALNPLAGSVCRTRKPAHAKLRYFTVIGYRQFVIFYHPLADGIEFHHIFRAQRNLADLIENV